MKSFKMRSYYLAPLLILAAVACAKRDSDFAKKAADAKATQQQKAGTQGTPAPSPSPGASPADTAADPDAKPAEDGKKAEDAKKEDPTAYEGDLTKQASCENKISLTAGDDEHDIDVKDIITNEDGTYILQSAELFLEQSKDSEKTANQLNAIATPMKAGEVGQIVVGKNLQITCHTVDLSENSTQQISGLLSLPYDISTKDGKTKQMRRDEVVLSKEKKSALSTIDQAKNFDLQELIKNAKETTTIKLRRAKDSKDFTLILQFKKKNAEGVSIKTVLGTYSLKK